MKTPRDIVERQQAIVSRINEIAGNSGQDSWRSTDGSALYPDGSMIPASAIDEDFTARIIASRNMFTGLPMSVFESKAAAVIAARSIAQLTAMRAKMPRRFFRRPRFIRSPIDAAAYLERVYLLSRSGVLAKTESKQAPVIVEIGGGFGALAYCVKSAIPKSTYIIVDLPGSLIRAAAYLAHAMPTERIDVYRQGCERGIFLAPHTSVSSINVSIDLAINTLSFSEMTNATVHGYAGFLAARLSRNGVLFEQNFDNRRLGENFCHATDILKGHFRHHSVIPGRAFRGSPSIWSN